MGLLQRSGQWLNRVFEDRESRLVTYWRKSTGAIVRDMPASIGRSDRDFEIGIPESNRERGTRDFIILAKRLLDGGAEFVPAAGDRVTEKLGTKTFVWELFHDPLDGAYRWHEEDQMTAYRIHTILVEVT